LVELEKTAEEKAKEQREAREQRELLRTEITTEVRGEVIDQVVKWLVGAVASLIVLAVVGWWAILLPYLKDVLGAVPTGSVIAVDFDRCPNGSWEHFTPGNGRVLVGSSENVAFRNSGGSSVVSLKPSNIPPIAITFPVFRSTEGSLQEGGYAFDRFIGGEGKGATGAFRDQTITSSGGVEPLNTMPPYLAITLCKKTS